MRPWIVPNGVVSGRAFALMAGFQAAVFLAVWTASPPGMIPDPVSILLALRPLLQDGLLFELWISFRTSLEALAIVFALSLFLSYLTVIPLFRPAAFGVASFRNFGISGFLIAFTVALGSGHALRVALLTFCMAPFFVTSMVSVISSIPREEWDDARVLRMGPIRSVWEVAVLGRLDHSLEILRQNAAMGWMVLTMVEGLTRTEGGLGVMMLNEGKHFNLSAVFAIQFVIFCVGITQDMALGWLRKVCCPYADLTLERK